MSFQTFAELVIALWGGLVVLGLLCLYTLIRLWSVEIHHDDR